eukprot:TRINITY_DN27666_c0_g1_i1.p1 TRINITY_DN27666_c0_g1~~TRINITY_DN27666_c0_g1_i1.p1  ORF type:complete len:726 (+),score=236.45 TRINITY_DN27666_c0_g1_i1:79-2178(+)
MAGAACSRAAAALRVLPAVAAAGPARSGPARGRGGADGRRRQRPDQLSHGRRRATRREQRRSAAAAAAARPYAELHAQLRSRGRLEEEDVAALLAASRRPTVYHVHQHIVECCGEAGLALSDMKRLLDALVEEETERPCPASEPDALWDFAPTVQAERTDSPAIRRLSWLVMAFLLRLPPADKDALFEHMLRCCIATGSARASAPLVHRRLQGKREASSESRQPLSKKEAREMRETVNRFMRLLGARRWRPMRVAGKDSPEREPWDQAATLCELLDEVAPCRDEPQLREETLRAYVAVAFTSGDADTIAAARRRAERGGQLLTCPAYHLQLMRGLRTYAETDPTELFWQVVGMVREMKGKGAEPSLEHWIEPLRIATRHRLRGHVTDTLLAQAEALREQAPAELAARFDAQLLLFHSACARGSSGAESAAAAAEIRDRLVLQGALRYPLPAAACLSLAADDAEADPEAVVGALSRAREALEAVAAAEGSVGGGASAHPLVRLLALRAAAAAGDLPWAEELRDHCCDTPTTQNLAAAFSAEVIRAHTVARARAEQGLLPPHHVRVLMQRRRQSEAAACRAAAPWKPPSAADDAPGWPPAIAAAARQDPARTGAGADSGGGAPPKPGAAAGAGDAAAPAAEAAAPPAQEQRDPRAERPPPQPQPGAANAARQPHQVHAAAPAVTAGGWVAQPRRGGARDPV